jgi:hypothetical protein
MARLRSDADVLAGHFHLTYLDLTPEKPRVKRRYGVCTADGRIALRLRHAKTGESLKYSSLVNTLCHELAHLRHFNHGPRFKRFYLEILEFARGQGIYRPGPLPAKVPQLELFPDWGEAARWPRRMKIAQFTS